MTTAIEREARRTALILAAAQSVVGAAAPVAISMGALTGVVGSLQALEVIKEITGAGESLAGRILIYDALDTRFRTVKLKWDPENPLTGENPTIRDLSVHAA